MIDPALLKQLGWSDDLIAEVTRTAANLNPTIPKMHDVEDPTRINRTRTSTSVFSDVAAMSTTATAFAVPST